jgi:flagellar biogenesis protein FliO
MARLASYQLLVWVALAAAPARAQSAAPTAPGPAQSTAPAAPARAAAAPPAAPAEVSAPAPAARVEAPPSEPPPSAWDREQRARGDAPEDARSLAGQIWRTLLSLLLVVGLIYGLGRLALWRLGRGRGAGAGAAGMKVVERLSLDGKHSLFVVEAYGKHRFLVGTGGTEGVKLLATLDGSGVTPGGSFAGALAAAARSGPEVGTGGEGGA